jgi:hypothetical protein
LRFAPFRALWTLHAIVVAGGDRAVREKSSQYWTTAITGSLRQCPTQLRIRKCYGLDNVIRTTSVIELLPLHSSASLLHTSLYLRTCTDKTKCFHIVMVLSTGLQVYLTIVLK